MRPLEPFTVEVDGGLVADLRSRLESTRWPDQLDGAGWDYGTERHYLEELCGYWASSYDWSAFTTRVNRFDQYVTTIDGQRIHFLHARSPEPSARPLLLTHGWPGSVAEFFDVVGPLSDPVAHGGRSEDAFHVVVPSLPGFGFSGPTTERDWSAQRMATAFAELMTALDYEQFFAQGGDWGSLITMSVAAQFPGRVAAAHVNLLAAGPPPDVADPMADLSADELAGLEVTQRFETFETGYQLLQSTKPQSLGYALADSPAGLAGWIVEKFRTWSDCGGDIERSFTKDQLLDNLSIYWLTGTINSSLRIYYETTPPGRLVTLPTITVPLGHARFPAEIYQTPRRWAEAAYPTLEHWTDMPRGGHFAAMEVPDLFVQELREFFRGRPLAA